MKWTIFILIFVLSVSWTSFTLYSTYTDFQGMQGELYKITKEISGQESLYEQLRKDIYRLKHDPKMIERVAREKFGLCKEGEAIYEFSENVNIY